MTLEHSTDNGWSCPHKACYKKKMTGERVLRGSLNTHSLEVVLGPTVGSRVSRDKWDMYGIKGLHSEEHDIDVYF